MFYTLKGKITKESQQKQIHKKWTNRTTFCLNITVKSSQATISYALVKTIIM